MILWKPFCLFGFVWDFSNRYFSVLAAPLCSNFLQMANIHNTTFGEVIGDNFNMLPLISRLLPPFLLFLVIAFYFDLFDKILQRFGFKKLPILLASEEDIEKGKEMLRKSTHSFSGLIFNLTERSAYEKTLLTSFSKASNLNVHPSYRIASKSFSPSQISII